MAESDIFLQLKQQIETRAARVGIIGLGYVGLPLALTFVRQGFAVIGFDTDQAKCEKIRKGQTYIRHIPLEPVRAMIEQNRLEATSDFGRLTEVAVVIICVPTPLTNKRIPDLSALVNTAETIAEHLRPGQLVVLESTTYPETTEEELLSRFSLETMVVGRDFFLAYSPEREDPGNKDFSVTTIPKVLGGITPRCLAVARSLYEQITTVVPVSSTRVAEFTKILENTFRSVNIALVNELKVLAHRMGIDLFEVIAAASTKPFGYTPFYPGPGLGGHCIPIDPFYLTWKAKEYDFPTRFIELAGEINTAMPDYVVSRISEALNRRGCCLSRSSLLILGVAYKKDVDDDRESPAYPLMEKLQARGARLSYNDPWIPVLRPTRKYHFDLHSVSLTAETLAGADAVIVVTDHSDYDFSAIVAQARLIVDTRNATAGIPDPEQKVVMA